jgi:hypothetical protein
MLNIRATMKGDKVLIEGLANLRQKEVPDALDRGLTTSIEEAYNEAFKLLSGPGRKKVRLRDRKSYKFQDGNVERRIKRKARQRGQSDMLGARPGSYPVPVESGHLRRSLDFVPPGRSKTAGGQTFRAGRGEAVLFDSAEYSGVILDPKPGESSHQYGPRPFLTDGLERVDIVGNIENEIAKELP